MNREQQEMALWREAYTLAISQGASYGDADEAATTAAESFRKRYPVEPTAPPAVWYDEPPFEKDGTHHPCWLLGYAVPVEVAYLPRYGWQYAIPGMSSWRDLAGRRVSPIYKPQEPTK